MNIRPLIGAFGLVVATSSTAFASPIAYTNEADWLAALASVTTETFEASPLGILAVGTTDIGQFSVTTNFSSQDFNTSIGDAGTINGTRQLNGSMAPVPIVGRIVTSFGSFDAGPTIVGFAGTWFNTAPVDRLGHPSDHLLAEINGTSFNFRTLLGSPGNGFLGFVDASGFSSISLTDDFSPNGLRFSLDDARIATQVSSGNVPEPATLLLFGTGLAAAGVQRFRRKR